MMRLWSCPRQIELYVTLRCDEDNSHDDDDDDHNDTLFEDIAV